MRRNHLGLWVYDTATDTWVDDGTGEGATPAGVTYDPTGGGYGTTPAPAGYQDWLSNYLATPADTGGPLSPGVMSLLDKLPDLLTKGAAFLNAQQLAQINIDRAQKGLAPLNAAAYGPQIGVGFTPQSQSMLMYAAIGIAAVMMLTNKKKSKA